MSTPITRKKINNRILGDKSKFLNELIKDCVIYNLKPRQGIVYCSRRLGEDISSDTYNQRIAKVGKQSNTEWLNWFVREGFVSNHRSMITDIADMIRKMKEDYLLEWVKPDSRIVTDEDPNTHMRVERILRPEQVRNHNKLSKLSYDIRESIKVLDEVMRSSEMLLQVSKNANDLKQIKDKLLKYGIEDIDEFANSSGLSKRERPVEPFII